VTTPVASLIVNVPPGAPVPSLIVRRTSASGTAATEISIRVQKTSMYLVHELLPNVAVVAMLVNQIIRMQNPLCEMHERPRVCSEWSSIP
jgi:hypothetical protein